MGSARDDLVTNRLAEFQRLAGVGVLQPGAGDFSFPGIGAKEILAGTTRLLHHKEGAAAPPAASRPDAESNFMREFFKAVGEIQGTLKEGRGCVQQMDEMLEVMLRATTQDAQMAASESLNQQVEITMAHISSAKRSLEALRVQADAEHKAKPSSAQRSIRTNMQRALANKHQQLLVDFQRSQQSFKQALEQRQVRELQVLCPEATGERLREMIASGETPSQIMVRRMAGAHASVLEEVQRIQDKHHDILRLEKSIADLAQMFQEMALLVDQQGDLLDSIETNVHSTNEYVGKGVKELNTALKIQANTQKWRCCLAGFCCVVVTVALAPLMLR